MSFFQRLVGLLPVFLLVMSMLTVILMVPTESHAAPTTSDNESEWHKSPPLPRARYGFDVCLVNDDIYVIGGGDEIVDVGGNGSVTWEITYIKPVDIYNIMTRTWSSKETNELTSMESHQLAVIGENIYAIGGKKGNSSTNKTWRLPTSKATSTFSWKEGQTLNHPRCNFSVAVVDKTIYVFGGRAIKNGSTTQIVEQVEAYEPNATNPSDRKWKVIENETMPIFSSASCVMGDKIYLFGGIWESGGKHKPTNRVRIFDSSTRNWTTGENMPSKRYGMEAVAYEGKMYIIGGRSSTVGNLSEEKVWRYDPITDNWTVLNEDLDKPDEGWNIQREDFGAVGYGDQIYVLGGKSSSLLTDVVVHDFKPCDLLMPGLDIKDSLQGLKAGEACTVEVKLKNIGLSPVNNVVVSLQAKAIINEQEISLSDSKTITFLKNGNETTLSFTITPPKGGWYDIDVKADREDWIPEINEENNRLMKRIHVGAPDLIVDDIRVRIEKNIGYRKIYITTDIRNSGEVNADDVTVEFFVGGEKIGKEKDIAVAKGEVKLVTYEWKVYWNQDIDKGNSWEEVLKDLINSKSTTIDNTLEIRVKASTPTSAGEAYTQDNSFTKEEKIEMDILAYIFALVLVIAVLIVVKRKVTKRYKLLKMRKKDKEKKTKPIPIIGTSQVGKTAYITMLDRELALGKEETDWRYTLMEGDEYIDRVRQWVDNGQHVPGTEKGVVEHVKMLIETQKRKLELSVADVSGEDVTALITPGTETPEHLVYVKESEALIVLVDPLKATDNQFRFRQFLASFAKTTLKKKSSKVIAVVFTKYDKYQDLFEGMTPEEFVKTKMAEVYNVLQSKYKYHQYFVCSAYGGEDQNGNPIRPPQPFNLTEPVKYVLNTLK